MSSMPIALTRSLTPPPRPPRRPFIFSLAKLRPSAGGLRSTGHCGAAAQPVRSRSARHARSARSACLLLLCLWRTDRVFHVLQEKFVRFVRMAGLMAYELEEERQLELPASGAWSLVRTRELAAKKPRVSVCFVVSVVCALVPPRRLWRPMVA